MLPHGPVGPHPFSSQYNNVGVTAGFNVQTDDGGLLLSPLGNSRDCLSSSGVEFSASGEYPFDPSSSASSTMTGLLSNLVCTGTGQSGVGVQSQAGAAFEP